MIQAVVFDLDGTVFDNEHLWEEAFCAVLDLKGDKWFHEPGLGIKDNLEKMASDKVSDLMVNEILNKYKSLSVGISIREGTAELIQKIKEKGWQTGLATGSPWFIVEDELERLQMELAFDVTTTGEEVLLSKPDPEIYLLTAQKMNLEPNEIIVVEDAIAGVRAATEAGMKVVGIESTYASKKKLLACGAVKTIENFSEFELENFI